MRRATEVATLSSLLREAEPGLSIATITGPGGVGKSYLIDEVLSREDPRRLKFLHLSVDASNPQARGDFFGLVDGQLATRSLPPPARPDHDYFPRLRRVAAIHRAIMHEASEELARAGTPEGLRIAALALLRAAHLLNETIPKSRAVVDVLRLGIDEAKLLGVVDSAWDAAVKLRALQQSGGLPGPLRNLFGITKKDRVKRDLHNSVAEALCGDIEAALGGYRHSDRSKRTHQSREGFERLLIVLDDFEATAAVLGDFVVSALLRRLERASFDTVMFIASRDDLEAIHPGFGQHAKRCVVEQLQLRAFDRATAFELMAEAGIPAEKRPQLFDATHGFPYLLSLVMEEATAPDAESALFTRKFFDRTTRWMTNREREWFTSLCYLDVVNEDTIEGMMGHDIDRGEVQAWFERESSIRDPVARVFTVRPLVREKALQYLAIRSPSRDRAMKERARSVNCSVIGGE